jgi:hypothetical protein
VDTAGATHGNTPGVREGTNAKDDFQHYIDLKRNTGDMHGQGPVPWCAFALSMTQNK